MTLALLLFASSGFYEEDLKLSKPIREEQYAQLRAYAASLPGRKPPQGASLPARIGYPAPAVKAKGEPRIERTGEDELGVYHRLWIRVNPHMEVYGLYILPKSARFPAPLVIAKHGGAGFPELALFHGGANYHDMIRGAVKEGYVVFAPLTVMQPRRDVQQHGGSAIPETVRKDLDAELRAKGTSLAAVELSKISAALDVLLKRKEIDPKRVGMTGLSFGSSYTLYAAALDKRITAAAGSCGLRTGPAVTEGMEEKPDGRLIDMRGDNVAGLIAPRPLHLQFGLRDPLLSIDSVRPAAVLIRDAYKNAEEKFDYVEFDGVHEFRGEPVWAFFRKWLK
jgi:dienelactone hydrolase